MNGTSQGVQAGMPDGRLLDVKSERKSVGSSAQYRERGSGNFRADTVTGKDEKIHLSGFQCECGAIFSNFSGKKSRITGESRPNYCNAIRVPFSPFRSRLR